MAIAFQICYASLMITKARLEKLYLKEGHSLSSAAKELDCSIHKVHYWMNKHKIQRRSISEAVYRKHNPNGDPFKFKKPISVEDYILFGMGIGLYWGEGTKSNPHAVRLGNTDPGLLKTFILFLEKIFSVKKSDLMFGLQLFTDIDETTATRYWKKQLGITQKQLYKVTITKSGSLGTYRKKSLYGVMTIYFHNVKLRNTICSLLTTHPGTGG